MKWKVLRKNAKLTTHVNDIKECNVFIVTVPTPINEDKTPNLEPLISASELVGSVIKKNSIVIYESTVYPGVTEDICVPILEKNSKLRYNIDFFCGYSPERISPGDKSKSLEKIVKITSGSNTKIAKFVDDLYRKIVKAGTYKVSSIKIAEASKVIENTQRDVNIALMNEFAMMFDHLKIQSYSVLVAFIWTLVFTYIILKVISMFTSLRVDSEQETDGLDTSLHGESGYNK